jgi:hypothetical protein
MLWMDRAVHSSAEQRRAAQSSAEQYGKREAGDDRLVVEMQYSGVEDDSPACTIELVHYAGCGRHLGKRDLSHKELRCGLIVQWLITGELWTFNCAIDVCSR